MKKWMRIIVALFLSAVPALSMAQAWPSRPVRIVVPFGAGTSSDIISRWVADELQAAFKQPFIVDNKPGASGILGADTVAKAAPDGYTLLLSTNTAHSVNPHVFKKLPYEPVKDFTPIARFCFLPFVLIVPADSPFKSVRDVLAYARANPGKVSYGYANSTGQVSGASFNTLTKMNALAIGYKTTPQALTDLLGGQVTFMFADIGASASLLQAGKLRAIAVTSEETSSLTPDLPTIAVAASLPGYAVSAWVGFVGPAGMPTEIVDKISAVIVRMLHRKEVIDKLAAIGLEAAPSGPKELGVYMTRQVEVWGQKVRDAGIEKQ